MAKKEPKFYVYILECNDNSYYVGYTQNLFSRVKYHYRGEGASYTRKRLPVKLVFYLEFSKRYEALYVEKQIKSWSRNKKKAFINGDFEMLQAFSKNTHHRYTCLKTHTLD
ncbi:GIY-YIG nuclease family protein [Candidatus Dependentiae bacterium]